MTDLAKLVVRLEAQSAQLLTELEKANNKINRFASNTSKTLNRWAAGFVGYFSAQAIVGFTKNVLDSQDKLYEFAQSAGTSTEALSGYQYAAQQSGVEVEALNKSIAKLSNVATDAAKGNKTAAASLALFGVSATNAQGQLKSVDQLLLELADSVSKYADGTAKTAAVNDIFGDNLGSKLIPFLNEGSEGIKKMTDEAAALGRVVSTEAAAAANDFNDNLEKLQATAQGAVGGALSQVTPLLKAITDQMVEAIKQGDGIQRFGEYIATAFKLVIDIGYTVYTTFENIGGALGALAAAAVQVAKGNFSEAWTIIKEANQDQLDNEKKATEFYKKLWEDRATSVVETAKAADKEVKKTLAFGGNTAGLEEVTVSAKPIEMGFMEQYYNELNDMTRTQAETAERAYDEQKMAVDELFSAGVIGAETYDARLKVINKTLDDATGVTERQTQALERQAKLNSDGKAVWEATRTPLEKYNIELTRMNLLLQQSAIDQETYNRAVAQAQDAFDEATNGANAFYKRASENAQDILGEGIEDAISGSFKGSKIFNDFANMLLKLAIQAQAAKIASYIFGDDGVGGKDGKGSGVVNTILGAVGSYFGGGRAQGGAVNPGMSYSVNEISPERFVPSVPGRIEKGGSGGTVIVNNTFLYDAPKGTVSRQTQTQTGAEVAKSLALAQRRNG